MSDLSSGAILPDRYLRRSPLYRVHLQAGAEFEEAGAAATVSHYQGSDNERQLAQHLGLADLSALVRAGFKGAGALAWGAQQGLQLPGAPNRAQLQTDGSLVARLSQEEMLILTDLHLRSSLAVDIPRAGSTASAEGVYLLPRSDSHCWFALTGMQASEVFSTLCGVDLRNHKFAPGAVAQTSLARVNAIIIRHDLAGTPGFYILSDITSAEFLWFSLLDAMRTLDGGTVGIAALRALIDDAVGHN